MSLNIQYCSDLHLEFRENREYLKANPLQPAAPVLVLAGDIMQFSDMERHKDYFNYVADNFETTYWLPGNHEYYHSDAAGKCGPLHESIRSNVHLVNNFTAVHGDVRLLLTTMWTKIGPAHEWDIQRSMNDFRVIKYDGDRLSVNRYNEMHDSCMAWLKGALEATATGDTVVATHHVPTFMKYPEQYRGDALNEAFAVELYDLIEPSNIACWIYGHHHCNRPEFKIGKTRMLTNQLGYVGHGEHVGFVSGKVIAL